MLAIPDSAAFPDEPVESARAFLAAVGRPGPLLVAVSGGGDSLALLLALHEAAQSGGRRIVAATVDHGLRTGSAGEARWVAALCARHDIGHRVLSWAGEKPSTGIQSAARLARYRLLKEEARRTGAVAILTAHTLDDQAETVAMRAARSGSETFSPGLAGMAMATLFERSAWILRPFLGIGRARLRQWLTARGQDWLDDPSNEDGRFERVRVRGGSASGVDPASIRAAQDARQRLSGEAAAVIADRVMIRGDSVAHVRVDEDFLHDAAERLAVETVVALMGGGSHLPQRAAADRLAAFLRGGQLSRMTIGRAVVDRRSQGLYVYRENRSLRPLQIASGEEALWDRRYLVGNRSDRALTVALPNGEEIDRAGNLAAFDDVPAGVVRRALGAQPVLRSGLWQAAAPFVFEALPEEVTQTRHFALFDAFLPDFDLELANQCMETFGRLGYGHPPVDVN